MWHAYITDHRTATLLHTASHFRAIERERRALIARANRWLHWRDMLTLKALGHRYLCWGGMFEDETPPEHANINNFKREFGGVETRAYDCTIPVTLKGGLLVSAILFNDKLTFLQNQWAFRTHTRRREAAQDDMRPFVSSARPMPIDRGALHASSRLGVD